MLEVNVNPVFWVSINSKFIIKYHKIKIQVNRMSDWLYLAGLLGMISLIKGESET
jgi:hypothetical protein